MMFVKGINHSGIFSTGVANPDIKIEGTNNTKAPKIPCCWVEEIDEMNNPNPTIENTKAKIEAIKIKKEPINGTPKNNMALR